MTLEQRKETLQDAQGPTDDSAPRESTGSKQRGNSPKATPSDGVPLLHLSEEEQLAWFLGAPAGNPGSGCCFD